MKRRRPQHGLVRAAASIVAALVAATGAAQPSGPARPWDVAPRSPSALVRAAALEGALSAGLPFGLAVVWHDAGRRVDRNVRAADTFSTNGAFLGIQSAAGISLFDASDGTLVRRWPGDTAHDAAYSLAIAADGRIAIGRTGGLELRSAASARTAARVTCTDACGPVRAVTFSPDGALLAYQGTRGMHERRQGLGYVIVLDARTGDRVARLEAIAARAFVAFTPDGREVAASSSTLVDDDEHHGVRRWDTSDWTLTGNVLGSERRWRAIGVTAGRHVGAYEDAGNLEIRDLAGDRLIWSVPLVAPSLDAIRAAGPGSATAPTRLDLVEVAPNGAFVLSYESHERSAVDSAAGTIVVRQAADGSVEAMYDVADVTGLAIAPDSRTFAYSTRFADSHTVVALSPSSPL